jgi:diacylglycerol kinase (ATP)
MKTFLILNPQAANGQAAQHFPKILNYFESNNVLFDSENTERRGHAEILAKEAVEAGYEKIVLVGGDGTMNETVNGIMKSSGSATLAIIPIGTCNDFVKSAGIPHDLDGALNTAAGNTTRAFDVGLVGDRYFINVIGVGFDVDIVQEMQQTAGKNSFVKYLATVMKNILFYKGLPLSIKSEDLNVDGNVLLLAIANGTSFGGNFNIAPQADPTDGLFELVMVNNVKPLVRFAVLSKVINGTHAKSKHVKIIKAKELEISSDSELVFQVEGEVFKTGKKQVQIRNIPQGINLVVADQV